MTSEDAGLTGRMALLWGQRAQPRRGPKPVLTPERVATAAIGIADAEGLAAVSMQRVAAEFDFTAMSLYRYVPARADLLDLMTDLALGEAPALDTSAGWRPALTEWTRHVYAAFRRHPWILETTVRVRPTGPRELSWMERPVAALADTGLTGPEQVDAAVLLLSHVRSQIQYAPVDAATRTPEVAAGLATALHEHADEYPALVRAAGDGAFGPGDDGGFDFGLRCVLDGIAAVVASRRAGPAGGAAG
ncbi:MAG TPA: TetR/AcrR family transcriptional regulator C-terminal domain-containing protein [Actinocatenispora sp.]